MKLNTFPDYLFTDEGAEIVTVEQMKGFIKIPSDITTDDALIDQLIKAARKRIEKYCGVSIVPKTVALFGTIQDSPYEPLFGPANEITSVKDIDGNDVTHTVEGINFKRIRIDYCKPVEIVFETPGVQDDEWATYIMQQVSWLYENRFDVAETRLEPALASILAGKRRHIV